MILQTVSRASSGGVQRQCYTRLINKDWKERKSRDELREICRLDATIFHGQKCFVQMSQFYSKVTIWRRSDRMGWQISMFPIFPYKTSTFGFSFPISFVCILNPFQLVCMFLCIQLSRKGLIPTFFAHVQRLSEKRRFIFTFWFYSTDFLIWCLQLMFQKEG